MPSSLSFPFELSIVWILLYPTYFVSIQLTDVHMDYEMGW
jgi:hypothetical protein